ncbi:hypothetical protein BD410DRAFT_712793 [Rickenella mellea]|uniref:Fe2OG dioxygenase domain-containing protein n=1 Tax=Rickenella mellea TaxID=50990 RepID=A0A4Y7QKG4_9AGAM|nr:hypothetical protein BD410DRAFT_712793 [Rickenella mellea]
MLSLSTRSPHISRAPSPISSPSTTALPFTKSISEFEVERTERLGDRRLNYNIPAHGSADPTAYDNELLYQSSVAKLIEARARPFSISGQIPLDDPEALTLFFRSQSGITHSLDFPIDVEIDTPPALDVLIAACRPHATCELDGFSDRESLYYPPTLPVTATLELANHPILDAIRSTLFPSLATGHHLVAVRDKLEVIPTGGHMCPQRRIAKNDGKVATIVVTLPVRFRGGALVIRDFDGNTEKYFGRGGKSGDLEWTAFLADCDHEVETIHKGCRVTMSYNVYLRTYGPTVSPSSTLVFPSDRFLDLISPILNMSRGRTIAFYLTGNYTFSPAEVLAETLVPHLKGGDALLYHSLKLYKLVPELRWAAGGYVWPVDRMVDFESEFNALGGLRSPGSAASRRRTEAAVRFPTPSRVGGFKVDHYSGLPNPEEEESEALRSRVEQSGAIPLSETDIHIVADKDAHEGSVTKERVPYMSGGGTLDKLIVNALLVVFVP